MANFQEWFFTVSKNAARSEVGEVMARHNFTIEHMGGGCLAWMRRLDEGGHVLVCDTGNGLGDSLTESYWVGRYDEDSNEVGEGDTVDGIEAAIRWCDHVG